GKDNKESAKIGANEVGMAITASTLTTVAVFLPMVLSSGVAGRLARPLSLTVCLALFSSLFVAITIVPMIASIILRNKRPAHHTTSSHEGGFDRARAYYKRLLLTSLKHKWKVVGGTILVFLASLGMVPILGTEFMPKQDTPFLFMLAKLPVGTALDETNKVIKKIEDEVIRQPEALYVSPFIGLSEATEMDVAWGTGAADVNEAQIMAKLVEKEERERSSDEVLEYIRTRLPKIEGATFNFVDMGEMMMGGGNQSPIEVKVFGKELSKLKDIADMIKARSEDIEGFRDVEVSLKTGKPELQIKVDRELASRLGLTVAQIGQAVKGAMLGIRTTMYRTGGDEYELRVRYQGFDRGSINDVENVTITSPLGSQVALYQVAKIEHGTGPLEITRENQERNVAVKGNTFGRDMGSIVGDIKKRLDQIELPKGYYVKYGGRYEDMEEAFASLAGALAIAIVLIYMVMAAQFESLAHPFIIMFTIPLAIIGVILGLFVFGKSLSVPSFMGVIILTGIVVNNGIVMIDYINQLRQRGVSGFDAIVEGATVRFRPVLITAITTILGMLPMALSQSQGAGMRAPMAIAVAFGLLVATILTLFVIPVLYSIMSRISYSKSA
ncbi:MAG: efflux RND transporter permease subunit, partial [Thermodesulfobacteriota bacterium]|nr:efflux RND transporter permease subunit [Thermodesulfobacteriota bacterium]